MSESTTSTSAEPGQQGYPATPQPAARLTKSQFAKALELKLLKEGMRISLDDALSAIYRSYERRNIDLLREEKLFWAQLMSEFGLERGVTYGIDDETQSIYAVPPPADQPSQE